MEVNNAYAAVAHKEGRWWLVDVPDLDVTGQARSVSEVETVAREIIGLVLDVEPNTVDVIVTVQLPDEIEYVWKQAKATEAVAQANSQAAAILARQAVSALRADGYTCREASMALGISPQRVQQLAAAA